MTIEQLLVTVTLLYLIQVTLFLVGLSKKRDSSLCDATPFVSVVVAARNEENHLARCLESVLDQTYPSGNFEVIVVNDNSTDGTGEICSSFAARYQNVSTFVATEDAFLRGKTNALNQAIDRARGEVILITDADCTVPRTWIEHSARRYAPETGIAGGVTLQRAANAFEGMQALDWAYLLGIAAAAVGMGYPLSTIGNNLSFRRKAYQQVGGYRKIKFSVTEDFVLFQSIVQTGKWKYLYPIDPHVLVISQPCATLKEIIRQKHRWGKGGLDMKLSGFLIMVIGFGMHLLIPLTFVLGSFFFASSALLIKFIADYAFLYRVLRTLERTDLLKYFYAFQIYYFLYVLLLPFIVFLGGKVIWKGRSY